MIDHPAGEANPLLTPWSTPFELPDFTAVIVDHYAPAFDAGMAEQRAEIDAITGAVEPPTFENTLVALERSGATLRRTAALFFNLTASLSSDELRAVEAAYAPKLAAHRDAVLLDRALFGRVDAVHRDRHRAGLNDEQVQLVERYHRDFVLAGAPLDDDEHAALRALNERLSVLSTTFQQQLLAATEAAAVLVTDVGDLAGMSPDAVAAARAAAEDRGQEGYLLTLVLPSGQPALAALERPDVRRRLHEASVTRASGGQHDNRPVVLEIARRRAERAALLGFPNHAETVVVDQTAGTTAAVDDLLGRLVPPAVANAHAEASILAEYAARDGVEMTAADWAFYAERVRADRYALDTAALRPYFELDRVLADGVFYAAERLYGLTFAVRTDLAAYHPDVRVWEVRDADGSAVGLFLGDFFARENKRGGAWMNEFVEQSTLLGTRPVVVNNLNVSRPGAGPTLLTLDEVRTLFHEFGHALHGLLSNVTYPRIAGLNVPGDFVEYPSQVNEMWALWDEVLEHYARHVETGERLPDEQVAAIRAAERWGKGFGTVEYLAATLLDQAWHRISPGDEPPDAEAFEAAALDRAGLANPLIPPRYRTTYFQHIFASGYSAGYYFYVWAQVLDADTVEWFTEAGGLTRENGDTFRRKLLSVGSSVPPLDAFRDVRGRDADVAPLLRRLGLQRAS